MKRQFQIFVTLLVVLCWTPVLGQQRTLSSDKPIKILAIGNSFSADALEYLDELAAAAGVPVVIGNLYIGGCSLERHWKNAQEDIADYTYYKNVGTNQTTTKEYTLEKGLADEEWDYITVQQASHFSGQYETYFPYLPNLVAYVRSQTRNPEVRIAFHQTWAYVVTSTHNGFSNYEKDQFVMYAAIVDAVSRATQVTGIRTVIPAGVAIQLGRSSALGDNFCRDGYHLNSGVGRYTAACVWFETLLGRSVVGNNYRPEGISAENARLAQLAARSAVLGTFWNNLSD